MTTLNNGSIVRLKSGGPKMTVNLQGGGDTVHCSWFKKNSLCHGVFSIAALKPVKRAKAIKPELSRANGVTKEKGLEQYPSPS